jgi:hypothetical protein
MRRRGDRIRWELEPFEVDLLARLRAGLVRTLSDPDPQDPGIARLFPSAVHGDDEADAELRGLIRDDLERGKRAGLDALGEILDRAVPSRRGDRVRVDLEGEEPNLVLGVLNDVRLTLAARIRVEEIDRETLGEHAPEAQVLAVVDHLAWYQEQLLAIVDPVSVSFHDDVDPDELA